MGIKVIFLCAGYGTRLERDLLNSKEHKDLFGEYDSCLSVLNDGTTCNEDRLGAVASINFAIEEFKLENDDVLIIGGDTLFYNDFDMEKFVSKFNDLKSNTKNCGLVTTYTCKEDETTKYGILEVDQNGKVKSLIEKPQPCETKSRLACPCFYLLSSDCSSFIKQFLDERKHSPLKEKDATGHLIKYLIAKCNIHSYQISGRFDVGGLQSYIECNDYFCK
uniref:UTP--glucose-1-phosphate uridylyltransferase-like n=1 Tax=Styela clava TaxID=7725 RepID=UPI00193AD8CC|nr:UTP--glucose-1-phosphate uridylyltransferase-like [Styela clava]